MTDLVLWVLTHQQTIAAIALTFLVAFVAGSAYQFVQDNKKTTSHANAK